MGGLLGGWPNVMVDIMALAIMACGIMGMVLATDVKSRIFYKSSLLSGPGWRGHVHWEM